MKKKREALKQVSSNKTKHKRFKPPTTWLQNQEKFPGEPFFDRILLLSSSALLLQRYCNFNHQTVWFRLNHSVQIAGHQKKKIKFPRTRSFQSFKSSWIWDFGIDLVHMIDVFIESYAYDCLSMSLPISALNLKVCRYSVTINE